MGPGAKGALIVFGLIILLVCLLGVLMKNRIEELENIRIAKQEQEAIKITENGLYWVGTRCPKEAAHLTVTSSAIICEEEER